jgi:SAM-dependent methyltransferase
MFFPKIVQARREALQEAFNVQREFEKLEESCIPSYVHPFLPAAWIAWRRPIAAARLYEKHAPAGPMLDFGSATGEVRHLIRERRGDYHFVEQTESLVEALLRDSPTARREAAGELGENRFAAVFALDSLEHNEEDELAPLLDQIAAALRPDGVFILSGPTENGWYRLGRRMAGFSGHYHHVTIYDIERIVERRFQRIERRIEPHAGIPLFSITAWRKRP